MKNTMKQTTHRNLQLNKDLVRELSVPDLGQIQGGRIDSSAVKLCTTGYHC